MITIQLETALTQSLPSKEQLTLWVQQVLQQFNRRAELSLRIVDEAEGLQLNQEYRGKARATNVLSFPFDQSVPLEIPYLGDIVLCAPVVKKEAQQQNKTMQAHYAHLIIHGVLHLLGYDHVDEGQAIEMERLEIHALSQLGFANPYEASMP